MIQYAKEYQLKTIKELWLESFPQENSNYADFFFRRKYFPENTLVFTENGQLQAALQRYPHEIMLHDRVLKTSMIVGVTVKSEYQRLGKMRALMQTTLDHVEHQELVTLIQAYEPEIYRRYGFEMVYYHNELKISRDQIKKISNKGCSYEVESDAMMKLYASFVKHFNGFYIRDQRYFDDLKEEIDAQNGKIIAYYNEGQLEGYATLLPRNQEVVMEECIYMNSVALTKLINLALQHRSTVLLKTSASENLKILFPDAEIERSGFMMARINDFDLFNRLYGTNVQSAKEAFSLGDKGLYINEFM
ncbi:MAG: enhanced intracellular survival protein Eis [Anaerorhabdus sp.]